MMLLELSVLKIGLAAQFMLHSLAWQRSGTAYTTENKSITTWDEESLVRNRMDSMIFFLEDNLTIISPEVENIPTSFLEGSKSM